MYRFESWFQNQNVYTALRFVVLTLLGMKSSGRLKVAPSDRSILFHLKSKKRGKTEGMFSKRIATCTSVRTKPFDDCVWRKMNSISLFIFRYI